MFYISIVAIWYYVLIVSYVTIFVGDDCEGVWCRVLLAREGYKRDATDASE